jgi:hypothetical protein
MNGTYMSILLWYFLNTEEKKYGVQRKRIGNSPKFKSTN